MTGNSALRDHAMPCKMPLRPGRPPHGFAHLRHSEVQFQKVANRTTTSMMLLAVFVAGIMTPTGICALMCERHTRVQTQRHCISPSDTMPGMVHEHSAMNHSAVEAMSLVMVPRSCETACITAERLNASRKVVPQVTAVQTAAVVLDRTTEFLAPVFSAASGLDSGPPAPTPTSAASFSIPRI